MLRKEDARLLRGRARFVDNVQLDRMAHGAFVRSPLPHAEVVAIDASRAMAAGAIAVLTARDLPFNDQPWIVRYWHSSIRNGLPKFLALDRVRFVGEPVAFVVATDRYRAEDFARLVDVDYRPRPSMMRSLQDRSSCTPNGSETSPPRSSIGMAILRALLQVRYAARGGNFGFPVRHLFRSRHAASLRSSMWGGTR